MPLQIGITGGIGSGKSTAARIFQVLGIPVYDADSRAKWLMNHDPELKNQIITTFGFQSYTASGELDRVYLASQAFHNPAHTQILNGLVHPRVSTDYAQWVSVHRQSAYLLKEAALLFESGSFQTLDKVIVVTAPLPLRMDRVLRRDPHRTRQDVEAIMARQLDETEKLSRADFILYNDESRLLTAQVLELDRNFRFLV